MPWLIIFSILHFRYLFGTYFNVSCNTIRESSINTKDKITSNFFFFETLVTNKYTSLP